jgi:hypothetical protein
MDEMIRDRYNTYDLKERYNEYCLVFVTKFHQVSI